MHAIGGPMKSYEVARLFERMADVLELKGYMELGVATARRGWVEASSVVNTWPLDKLRGWLGAAR
jgi:hypothetical protein